MLNPTTRACALRARSAARTEVYDLQRVQHGVAHAVVLQPQRHGVGQDEARHDVVEPDAVRHVPEAAQHEQLAGGTRQAGWVKWSQEGGRQAWRGLSHNGCMLRLR